LPFLLFDLLGSALYAGIYLLAGISFSAQVQALLEMLPQVDRALPGIGGVADNLSGGQARAA
jgi:membrane protein DedA with SNARE-associated domain